MEEYLRDMALFMKVAQSRSFTRAAQALGLPASTLSRRVTELERSIGLRLLNRTTRKLELTDAGARYFERCCNIVEQAQAAHEEIKAETESPSGHLRVSMPVDFGVSLLAPLVGEFIRRYPGITFELDLSPRRADLVVELMDVAIRVGGLGSTSMIARRITKFRTHLYASPDYLQKAAQPADPDDLTEHECIRLLGPTFDQSWILHRAKERVKIAASGRFAVNNAGMVKRLATDGLGIALLAERIVGDEVESGRLQRVLPAWEGEPLPVSAVVTTRLLPARCRVFIEFLREQLTDH